VFGEDLARSRIFGDGPERSRASEESTAIRILRQLTERGVRIVFEGPTPILRSVAFRCADWYDVANPICRGGTTIPRRLLEEFRTPVLKSFGHVAREVKGVTVWDPFSVLCPGDPCAASWNGAPLIFDGDHLTGYANAILLPSFEHFMMGFEATDRI
jgi:hypothetical protein